MSDYLYYPSNVSIGYERLYRKFKGLPVGPVDATDFDVWFTECRLDFPDAECGCGCGCEDETDIPF